MLPRLLKICIMHENAYWNMDTNVHINSSRVIRIFDSVLVTDVAEEMSCGLKNQVVVQKLMLISKTISKGHLKGT